MITKEITLSHSVNEIKEALNKIATDHSIKFNQLEFQDSFSMIKIIGTINFSAIVTIELYYEQIEDNKNINNPDAERNSVQNTVNSLQDVINNIQSFVLLKFIEI